MAVRKRGAGWQVDVTVAGQRIREQHATQAEAQAAERRLLEAPRPTSVPAALRHRKTQAAGGPRLTTMHALIEHTIRTRWSDQRSGRVAALNAREAVAFFGPDFPVADVTTSWVEEYAAWLAERGSSDATINRKMSALQVALKTAADRGDLDKLPRIRRRAEGRGRERVLSAAEEAAVLATLQTWGRHEEADLVALLIDTGLRVRQEALALRRQDFVPARRDRSGAQIENGWVIVRDGKGGTRRRVPLTVRAEGVLAGRCKVAASDRLWTRTYDQVRHVWDRMRAHLGLEQDEEFVIHMLRHTCASRLAEAGVPLLTIKEWCGHTQVATTQRYAHLSPNALATALPALEGNVGGTRSGHSDPE